MTTASSATLAAVLVVVIACLAAPPSAPRARAADWNPRLAAQYLDGRQKDWFAWPRAASPDGPCVSCHTGMTYLLARPALRRALGESEPTTYEQGLLARLRAHVGEKPAGALQSVEVIFAAMFLAQQDAGSQTMDAGTRKAFDQLWALQLHDGAKGAWKWYAANLDPWENPGSAFYGASLGALAVGLTPAGYAANASVRDHVAGLRSYLGSAPIAPRPLHDRLALLWASSRLKDALSESDRASIVAEALEKQQPDGSWTIESLGPWMDHPDAPSSKGANSYATAFSTYALLQSGAVSEASLARAMGWLASHQDHQTGAWPATSMNKHYPEGSMESFFMQDAATAFASLALLGDRR